MTPTMSCALNTSLDSPDHARIAEELGYHRAWFYDSPAIAGEVWMQLARAADRTERIGLATGVLVPALRHPMVTAAAVANLVGIAGKDRVVVGIGTGYTGRITLGQRPSKWSDVRTYINALKALLRGEQVRWDGALIQMRHRPRFGANEAIVKEPIELPFMIAAQGPKGYGTAQEFGDGVFTIEEDTPAFDWRANLTIGTVLDEGEPAGSPRAVEAGGHAATVFMHYAMEFNQPEYMPGGTEWALAYQGIPAETRHLEMHEGHLWSVNDRDRPYITGDAMTAAEAAMDVTSWRDKVARLKDSGCTEIAYQPAGPDIPRELEAFAKVMQD